MSDNRCLKYHDHEDEEDELSDEELKKNIVKKSRVGAQKDPEKGSHEAPKYPEKESSVEVHEAPKYPEKESSVEVHEAPKYPEKGSWVEEALKYPEKGSWVGARKATRKNKSGGALLPSVKVDAIDALKMIDTFDRPGSTHAESNYARRGTYGGDFKNEPGKRIPKVGAFAEAGVGRARAEISVLEAEAKGPNASAGAEASVLGVGAMARAEIASASAKAGPVGLKLGLGVDTGASFGLGGVEAKFLGTGFSIGPKTSVSLLGSEASCAVM